MLTVFPVNRDPVISKSLLAPLMILICIVLVVNLLTISVDFSNQKSASTNLGWKDEDQFDVELHRIYSPSLLPACIQEIHYVSPAENIMRAIKAEH